MTCFLTEPRTSLYIGIYIITIISWPPCYVIVYIYLSLRSLRLCERQTTTNIEKQKNRSTDFLNFSSFFVEEPPLISIRVAVKRLSLYIYIYLYIEKFEVAWLLNGSEYGKTKNTCSLFLDSLSFLWKTHLRISNRVAVIWLSLYIHS